MKKIKQNGSWFNNFSYIIEGIDDTHSRSVAGKEDDEPIFHFLRKEEKKIEIKSFSLITFYLISIVEMLFSKNVYKK